jgi:ribosomal protein L7/L12
MGIDWIIIIGGLFIIAILAFFLRSQKEKVVSPAFSLHEAADTKLAGHDEIVALLAAQKKIQAIKLYREETGVGLKEAKAAVEQMEQDLRLGKVGTKQAVVEADGDPEETLRGEIVALLAAQKKIQAIKLYREKTGVGLKEAKAAVEQMEQDLRSGNAWASQPFAEADGDPEATWRDEIVALLAAQKKIQAIKLYREKTGVGLKEAKAAVEQIEAAPRL